MTTVRRREIPILFITLVAMLFASQKCQANETSNPAKKPLRVFILAGQSNMQGHAHVRTIDAMRLNPKTAPLLDMMRDADGTDRTCQKTWISSIGSANEEQRGRLTVGFGANTNGPKIGPEFTFGLTMETLLDEPILIIKTAWGGKSLHTDFRPPSAGDYEFNETQLADFKKQGKDIAQIKADKVAGTGHYYRLMLGHVKAVLADIATVYPEYDTDQGYELSGLVWFQGWNDMVDRGSYPSREKSGGYDQYSQLLSQFIRDIRNDLDVPRLPVVIGVMGVGGATSHYGPDQKRYKAIHQNFRDAMAAPATMPEFEGNVIAVLTENYWDMEVTQLRDREKLLKAKTDKINAEMKQGVLSRDIGQARIEKIYAETFDERELQILRQSTSNFEFHYLGSAGIMAQIGKGFAEAMRSMIQ
ncbi:hypothetical protein CA13_17370 [Planctomycetes bacterium CA13]|uniref:Sialate O-acetylesterase domain-containing protein n=1 Tax=Novipirellula herctigrandis TaxID=2527986 RepID=A0A5C5YZ51_9BACT|nr:hypothetical protein CA13_17370 [Planctomycetes bacterium CA13]